MKIIIEQAKLIKLTLGNQEIDNSKNYRLLKFCVYIDYKDVILLYNNLTKEFLLLESAEYEKIISGQFSSGDSLIDCLISKWFLVPEDNDDMKLSQQITSLARCFCTDKAITTYDILTTTACNARCFYCYEAGVNKVSMTTETAHKVGEYITANCAGKKVSIKWFGGEPLCNVSAINIISEDLRKNNVAYTSNMTTNGYLFNHELIKAANELWNLRYVQITLDGTKDTYNKVKNYISADSDPFSHVIENIGKLLKNDIAVRVRLNMDNYNEHDLYELVDYLNEAYGAEKKFSVYAHLIFNAAGYIGKERTNSELKDLGNRFLKLEDYIFNLGLSGNYSLKKDIKINHCMADSINAAMITPEGKLGRCEHHIADDFYGDIFETKVRLPWTEYRKPEEKCAECPVFPTCLRLVKCDPDETHCFDYKQRQELDILKRAIINEYEKFLKRVQS